MAQVEIIGPSGVVHYRRPHTHPMLIEALNTQGYSLRCENCGLEFEDPRLITHECPPGFKPSHVSPWPKAVTCPLH